MTVTEKILARAGGVEEARAGDIVNAKVDLVYTIDYLGKVLYTHLEELGAKKVFDPGKVVVVFDHQVPAPDIQWAQIHQWIRQAVKKYGGTLYDIGRHGISHQLVVEEGYILPGTLTIGTDSHAPTGGAMGGVTMGIGATDAAIAMATGELWLRVPESVKVVMTGEFRPGATSRDVMLWMMSQKGWDGGRGEWAYKAVEFTGPTVKRMDIAARLTTTNLVSDMGAKNGIIEADETTDAYLNGRARSDYQKFTSSEGAEYGETFQADVSRLEPQVACPHSPDNVKPVSEVAGTKIDQAVIGSCTSGRIEDLRLAASVLKGRKVSSSVRMIITPASTRIYNQALREGLFQVFMDAGAVVAQSTCGPCYGGQLGALAPGEVCITATPRNMKGRMGHTDSYVYSANPATVAASAIEGVIADPSRYVGA